MKVKEKDKAKTEETNGNKDKAKALEMAIAQIEKNFGKGSIMKLGDRNVAEGIQVVPTGSVSLDIATGIGGLPRGRIVEIYGPEASGKTTLSLGAVAQAQRAGGIAAFIDAEHALDVRLAAAVGVDTGELLVSQPDTGEQALEVAEALVRSGSVDIIVIDSVAALVPKAEIESDMGDSLPGLQARLMSQALRKLTAIIAKSKTTVIFINQLRMKIGVMFGSPETTTGGNALKFYSSMRIDVRRIESIKNGQDIIGNRVRAKMVKNKLAPPFRQAEFDIIFGKGVSVAGEAVDIGVDLGIIEKSGAWYSYNGQKIGQGRDNAKEFLEQNPEVFAEVHKKIAELSQKTSTSTAVSGFDEEPAADNE